jgi:hypothetical protein
VRKPGTWCIVESCRLDDVSSRAGCSGRIQDILSAFEPQFTVALRNRAHLVWCVVFRQGSKLVDDDLRARSLYRGVDSLGIECARKEYLSAILFESLETWFGTRHSKNVMTRRYQSRNEWTPNSARGTGNKHIHISSPIS